jgi:thioredoxin reductase (NADPH)
MAKPVIFSVDDDSNVLEAIEQDLRREYGSRYRILRADSGRVALEALKQLKLRNEPVALLLVDQRMPQMTGIELLEEAVKLHPDARRVLLTAYADTDVAIRAINKINLDHYLLKPWNPPEEQLYPVLQDLLDDWQAHYEPSFEGIRVIGDRWSPRSHHVKDFLARNQLPYEWLDIETGQEARQLLESANARNRSLPLLFFPDGSYLADPTTIDIAEKAGLKTRPSMPFNDLTIIGAGPAGLAAAVYAASEGLGTVVIEREAPGGQAGTSSRIENYLGFPSGLSGADLTRRAVTQARRFGAEILTPQEATHIRVDGPYRYVTLADGSELCCHALLIATGVSYHKLDAPGIEKLTGAGVYYGAALSEARACQGQDIFLVGAGNSAGQAAMYFAKHARTVTMLVRGDSLAKSMSQYLVHQIRATENIKVRLCTVVVEAHGQDHLEAITVTHVDGNLVETLATPALFLFIGAMPHTDWLKDVIERNPQGFILSGQDLLTGDRRTRGWPLKRDPFLLETSVPGVFVAGDVRSRSVKRVASAVGEGSIAVQFIHEYLGNL